VESNFFEYNPSNKPINIIEYTRLEAENKEITEKEIEDLPSNSKLILIKNEKNYGFAKGNNIGFTFAIKNGDQYFLTLNNDTVVARDFLDPLIDLLEKDAEIGIAGPTYYYYDKPDTIWATGVKINWWTGKIKEIEACRVEEVDSVSGCAMIIKKTVFNDISLFDTRFPFGNEDYEFCTRARRGNFKVVHVPDSKIWHKVSKSRNELMRNVAEREALLGNTGDFRLKDRQLFFKICSPSKVHNISRNIFYFVFTLPFSALLSCRKSGVKVSLTKAKLFLQEIFQLIK
jgi:hypothetical protein